jgi:hypothetical protein
MSLLKGMGVSKPNEIGHSFMEISKNYITVLLAAVLFTRAVGDIVVPGANGTDGMLNITTNTVIDLSRAVTAAWDSDNSANAGKGVYDASKWAVVFKYSSVTIRSNATVTFRNHASRAPVVWLVSGDVRIDGNVNLDGQDSVGAPLHAEPGPGGFRGSTGTYPGSSYGAGFGIGGGSRVVNWNGFAGGNYGVVRKILDRASDYGNPSLLPLLGGGGGGSSDVDKNANGGGAGGGAILIAATATIEVNGSILARGGRGAACGFSGSGSGGGIRLVSEIVRGRGGFFATPLGSFAGCGGGENVVIGNAGYGRIRIERTITDPNGGVLSIVPDPSVVTLAQDSEALIWPPTGAPEVRITSIGGGAVSLDPRAGFGAFGPDVALPITNKTFVTVETKNVEPQSQVIVRVTPRANANFLEANAAIVSSTNSAIQWQAGVDVNVGYSAVQVRVVRP